MLLHHRSPRLRRGAVRRWQLLVALLLCAAASSVVPPAAAHAQDRPETVGIRLVDGPVDRADDPRARQYIVDHLAPGTTITRRVEVENNSGEVQDIALYPAAAEVTDEGFTFGTDREENELTGWTKIDQPSLELAAGAKGQAEVTIVVPADASAGERYGVVWAQPPAADDGEGVRAVNRVGIRLYLSVGPGGEPASDFEITDIKASRDRTGIPSVSAMVRNTGGRALDLTGQLTLTDGPGSSSAGPFPTAAVTTLGIGKTEQVSIALGPDTPAGPWTADLELTSGTTTRDATARITFPDAGDPAQAGEPADGGGLGWVLPIAILLAVLVAVAVASLIRRRQRS